MRLSNATVRMVGVKDELIGCHQLISKHSKWGSYNMESRVGALFILLHTL